MWHVKGWLFNLQSRLVNWWLSKHFGVSADELRGGDCRCQEDR